jgi:hypothetical protein
MPKYKDDPPGPTSNVYIRVEEGVQKRVKKAHKEGVQATTSEAAFYGYLIKLGINVYEKGILPLEKGEGWALDLALNKASSTDSPFREGYNDPSEDNKAQ